MILTLGIGSLYAVDATYSDDTSSSDGLITSTDTFVDTFDVNTAIGDVRNLKYTIDGLTQQLFELDQQERTEEGISDKYREVRNEIVNVINTIQRTTDQVDVMMRRVSTYKQNIQTTADNIKRLRSEIDETR